MSFLIQFPNSFAISCHVILAIEIVMVKGKLNYFGSHIMHSNLSKTNCIAPNKVDVWK